MQRRCAECNATIPPQTGRQQPRKFCTSCRPPRNRRRPGAEATVTALPDRPREPDVPTLESATLSTLTDAGRAATPKGLLVLELARQIMAGGHSGASLASLSNAFDKALDAAVKGAQQPEGALRAPVLVDDSFDASAI